MLNGKKNAIIKAIQQLKGDMTYEIQIGSGAGTIYCLWNFGIHQSDRKPHMGTNHYFRSKYPYDAYRMDIQIRSHGFLLDSNDEKNICPDSVRSDCHAHMEIIDGIDFLIKLPKKTWLTFNQVFSIKNITKILHFYEICMTILKKSKDYGIV